MRSRPISDYLSEVFLMAAFFVFAFFFLFGCGGSSGPFISPTITINAPSNTNVDPSNSAGLTATLANDVNSDGVSWTLSGSSCSAIACGTLSGNTKTSVTYTAPSTVTTDLTVSVTATSIADSNVHTRVTLNVPPNPTITTASGTLPAATVGVNYSTILTGSGGITPYAWSISSGNLPAGLTLDAQTGAITGIPIAAGFPEFTVKLTDAGAPALNSSATYSFVITSAPNVNFATNSLPVATVGQTYTASVLASGGVGALTYAIASGSLPPGLTLSSTGLISGTPTSAGVSSFTLKATDPYGDAGISASLTIVTESPLTITSSTLPTATAGVSYTTSLSANGGTGAGYTWTLLSGTALSSVGLNLSSDGIVSGTPTAGETSSTILVQVADSASHQATATITLSVNYPSLTITTTNLPTGVVSDYYSATLTASSPTPTAYTWTAKTPLPAGLVLSASGNITGTPTTPGTTNLTVSVTDFGGNTVSATLPITINPALAISNTSLPTGIQGTAYSYTLTSTGGSGTGNTWTVTSGIALSSVGLSLSSSGVITGIPTAGESATPFTVQITDSAGDIATSTFNLAVTAVTFQGQVLSGAQPIAGSTIQIYAVGNSGNGSASTPMLTQPVTTDSAGYFVISGLYTCGQSSTGATIPGSNQVYIVATGGTVGANQSANNSISLVTALGNCRNLSSATNTIINELTTVASAWALAPFTTSVANIGASATNTLGIQNAFLDAALLANPATGSAATLPTNLTVEGGKLIALANILASCVDSDGGADCGPLFIAATPANGSIPADVFTAALNIVKNPGLNVAAVYGVIGSTPPYTNTLTQAPNDWTMALTVTGGGLNLPTAIDVDASGNVWVADYPGRLSAFTAQGTPFASSPYGNGILNNCFGLTIDTSGDIWVSNEQDPTNSDGTRGSVAMFLGSNSASPGAYQFYVTDQTVNTPVGLAADTNGDILIANASSSMVSIYTYTGSYPPTLVATNLGQNIGFFTEAVTADANHGAWLANEGDGSAVHVAADGTLLSHTTCCAGADAIAMDVNGNVWVSDPYAGQVAEVSPSGALLQSISAGGVTSPSGLAIDAAQNIWITNISNSTFSELAGSLSASPGTGLSPSIGYGLDANLSSPHGIVPDSSGNLWVANYDQSDLVVFFGLATPTATPIGPIAQSP